MRPTSAQIDLTAIAHNVAVLTELAAPAQLCVVVKADGYGHGALPVARTAVSAGAPWLAVALVEEGIELRQGGIEVPILLLSEPRPNEMIEVFTHQLRPTVYSPAGAAAVAAAVGDAAVSAAAKDQTLPVHLKVDTGMHRVGATPEDALKLAQVLEDKSEIELEGIWTHCATADDMDNPFADIQLSRFEDFLTTLAQHGIRSKLRHAANSATLLTRKHGHFDLVRVGLAVYGISPLKQPHELLRPAMQLRSQVSFVKEVSTGAGVSYGQLHHFDRPATIATVPIGYADGVRRDFGLQGGEVLIGGRRNRVVGAVTMDQLMVEIPSAQAKAVQPGDEVVLIGEQGDQEISVSEVGRWIGTIPYEVICDVGKRVRREYV